MYLWPSGIFEKWMTGSPLGRIAEWIPRLPPEQKVLSSNLSTITFWWFLCSILTIYAYIIMCHI